MLLPRLLPLDNRNFTVSILSHKLLESLSNENGVTIQKKTALSNENGVTIQKKTLFNENGVIIKKKTALFNENGVIIQKKTLFNENGVTIQKKTALSNEIGVTIQKKTSSAKHLGNTIVNNIDGMSQDIIEKRAQYIT